MTTRPDFDDDADEPAPGPAPRSPALAWLRLMRLPNVFTAIADVAMGYLIVNGPAVDGAALAGLIAASACLYTAGMVLNDVFDFDIDTKERPFRPLPSGQIGLPTARAFGFALLLIGIGLGWLAGFAGEQIALQWRSGAMATALAAGVLLYDAWLKRTPLGPLGMGLCRFFNVLLGMSAARQLAAEPLALGYSGGELMIAAGIGVYIIGVTVFAKQEAGQSRSSVLLVGVLNMIVGVLVLGAGLGYLPPQDTGWKTEIVWLLLGLLMVTVVRRALTAVMSPTPDRVQQAVKHSILSLIWLDAAAALATAPPHYAMCIAALLIPALLLGMWVYST